MDSLTVGSLRTMLRETKFPKELVCGSGVFFFLVIPLAGQDTSLEGTPRCTFLAMEKDGRF